MANPPLHMDTIELTSSFGVDEFRSRKDINLLWTSAVKYDDEDFHINHFVCMVEVEKLNLAPPSTSYLSKTQRQTSKVKKKDVIYDSDDSDEADAVSISSEDSERSIDDRGKETEDVTNEDDFIGNLDILYGQKSVKPPKPVTPQFDKLPKDLKAEVDAYNKPNFRKIPIPLMIKCVIALEPEELPYDEKCGNRFVIDNSYNIIEREKSKDFSFKHTYPDDRGAYHGGHGVPVVYQRNKENEWFKVKHVQYLKNVNCLAINGKKLDDKEHEDFLIIKITYHDSVDFPFKKKTYEFLRTPSDLRFIKKRAYVAYFGDDSSAPGPHGNRKHVSTSIAIELYLKLSQFL